MRKVLAPRYKNVFGKSRVVLGSQLVPRNIDVYTGKISPQRKGKYQWQPNGSLYDYFLKVH